MPYYYKLHSIHPLSARVMQVWVEPEDQAIDYQAGQYTLLSTAENAEAKPFSVANAPHQKKLEFHIRHVPTNPFTQTLLAHLKARYAIYVEGPLGRCTLQPLPLPIVFFATGTGFAPIKALIEEALSTHFKQPMHLFWWGRDLNDLYLHPLALRWQTEHPNFRYTTILDPLNDPLNHIESTLQALLNEYKHFNHRLMYAAGYPLMIQRLYEALQKHGLRKEHFFSDVFP